MVWIDIAIIGLILLSAVISIFRGFVREVLSLVAWVAAFYVALRFSGKAAEYLTPYIGIESLRMGTAFLGIFFIVLILFSLLNYVIARLVDSTGLSGTDRFLGVIFGLARGAAIIIIMVMLAELTPVAANKSWQKSVLIPQFKQAVGWVKGYLPADIAKHFDFEQSAPSGSTMQPSESVTEPPIIMAEPEAE